MRIDVQGSFQKQIPSISERDLAHATALAREDASQMRSSKRARSSR